MTVYFFLANNASYLVFASMPDFAIRLCHTKVMGYNRYIHIHSNDDSLFTLLSSNQQTHLGSGWVILQISSVFFITVPMAL